MPRKKERFLLITHTHRAYSKNDVYTYLLHFQQGNTMIYPLNKNDIFTKVKIGLALIKI